MDAQSFLLTHITYHAVFRYVQRIMGVELPDVAGETEKDRAFRYVRAAGLTMDQARTRIMTPAVARACLSGARFVRCSEFRAVIAPNSQTVRTILPIDREHNRLKVKSEREARRSQRQYQRRMRRRPASEDRRGG
jgi:hypothetical protein